MLGFDHTVTNSENEDILIYGMPLLSVVVRRSTNASMVRPPRLEQPFITTPDRQSFYKRNIGYDAKTDQLITTTVQDGYGANYAVNKLYFYNMT